VWAGSSFRRTNPHPTRHRLNDISGAIKKKFASVVEWPGNIVVAGWDPFPIPPSEVVELQKMSSFTFDYNHIVMEMVFCLHMIAALAVLVQTSRLKPIEM
jgi:hypothetical protein